MLVALPSILKSKANGIGKSTRTDERSYLLRSVILEQASCVTSLFRLSMLRLSLQEKTSLVVN